MDVYRVNRAVYGNFLCLALTSDSFKLQFVHLLSAVTTVLIKNTGIMFKFCKLRFIKSELILPEPTIIFQYGNDIIFVPKPEVPS